MPSLLNYYMELMRRSLWPIFCSKLDNSGEGSSLFIENGSKLLEEFIAHWDGGIKISLRNFSSNELAQATDNFSFHGLLSKESRYRIYRGSFEKRQILVKKYDCIDNWEPLVEAVVRDIVISSHMSFHKNVLKLMGYCLDYQYPALVYQSPENCVFLAHHLLNTKFTWENKLSLSLDIANAVAYLHTGFQTPVIHRNLKLGVVVIDKHGTAKLAGFPFCIWIPLGECQVEDDVIGTFGYVEPKYMATGVITEKSDVYSFGVVLIELLTGRKCSDILRSENFNSLWDYLESSIETDEIVAIVNGNMVMEGESKQIRAFAALALNCIAEERESRPEMVEVAKELRRIQRSVCSS